MLFLPVLLLLGGVPLLRCAEIFSTTDRLRSFHLIDDRMSLPDALNACRRNFTDLVTIYDEKDHDESVRVLKSVTKASSVSAWIGASSCKWSNGDLVTFINYGTFFTPDKYCGAINTGGSWEFSDCNSAQKYFICYDQDDGKQSQNYSLIRENSSWFEAQSYCRRKHTDLLTIRDETENERVKKTLNETHSFWIGFRYDDKSIYWFDGGHSHYTKMKPGSSKACFTFLTKQESWMKMNENENFALCYRSRLHVSADRMRWEEALDYCERRASRLLCIHSEDEQKETERELERRSISGPVWLGLRQSRVFGFWIWIDGIQVGSWNNWRGGIQPEYSHHCGAVEEENGEYKWSDKDCRSQFIAICAEN